MYTNELYHHGVKGQKWGVRRYQNADGTLTNAGRKRLAKQLSRDVSLNYDTSRPYYRSENFNNTIKNQLYQHNVITHEDKQNLLDKRKQYQNALEKYFSPENNYHESKQCEADSAKAYKQTIEWFEKNNPSYLKEIITKNDGQKAGLDAFHDFRITFSGFEDEAWSKGQREWSKTHNNKAIEAELKKSENIYNQACKDVGSKLLGEYGNITTTRASKYLSGTTMNDDIASVVQSIINQAFIDKNRH